jgi:multidrug resistance efflux pump
MKKNRFIIAGLILGAVSLSAMDIYAQVSAGIISVAKVGGSVNKNDILVKLDDRQIQVKIDELEAVVKLKKTIFDDKTKILKEDKELFSSTVASQRDVDLSTLEATKSQFEYESKKAELEFYKLEKEKYTIRAPFNCTVKEVAHRTNTTNIYQPKVILEITPK